MTSNRRRRSRYTPPINRRHHRPRTDGPTPGALRIGWYDPDGNEIEITIDLNDPAADPFLVDLIHLMTDTCPHCNGRPPGGRPPWARVTSSSTASTRRPRR